jgi:hypothetical protein
MAYTAVSNVTDALSTLYSGSDSVGKKEASRWLESFQRTVSKRLISAQIAHSFESTFHAHFLMIDSLRPGQRQTI